MRRPTVKYVPRRAAASSPAGSRTRRTRESAAAGRGAWGLVAVMPKPDLIALTGGYRKTPVLQIGSDIYCDTKVMVRVLDRIRPEPPLMPKGHEASCAMQEQWSEHLFQLCAPVPFQPQGLSHF